MKYSVVDRLGHATYIAVLGGSGMKGILLSVMVLLLVSCSDPKPTPDIQATVESAVATQMAPIIQTQTVAPTIPPTATPLTNATSQHTATPVPTFTPLPIATATPSLVDIVKRISPSIVRIDTESGMGSGVIIENNVSDGSALVLTAFHVINRASFIEVRVFDSETFDGNVVGVDTRRDTALIRICCHVGFSPLAVGNTDVVKTGSDLYAVGYPIGNLLQGRATVTQGIVSAVRYNTEFARWEIQTDAPLNPGNSGGPILSRSGNIIGIVSYKYIGTEGLAFAIGEQTINEILPILKAGTFVPPSKYYFTGTGKGRSEDFTITASKWTVYWETNISYCGEIGHIRLFKQNPFESKPNILQSYIMDGGAVFINGPGTYSIQVSLCPGASWVLSVYNEIYNEIY
jgi:S1-C subfamily serine protease